MHMPWTGLLGGALRGTLPNPDLATDEASLQIAAQTFARRSTLMEVAAQFFNRIFVMGRLGVGTASPRRSVEVSGSGDTRLIIADTAATSWNLSASHGSAGANTFSIGIEGVGVYFGLSSTGACVLSNQAVATAAATPTLSANKPGASSGVATWLPITVNGVAYYIPLWT